MSRYSCCVVGTRSGRGSPGYGGPPENGRRLYLQLREKCNKAGADWPPGKTDREVSRKISIQALTAWTVVLAVLVVDQLIKIAVKTSMTLYESVEVTSWFRIYFTENKGMAFGMDFIGTMFLTLFRIAAVVFFVYVLRQVVRRRKPIGYIVCLSMIVAGAVGNIIDNCFYGLCFTESLPYWDAFSQPAHAVDFGAGYGSFLSGRVVDMFYFPLFTWPDWMPLVGGDVFFGAVFNFADASISCGAVALLLFYSKHIQLQVRPTEKKADEA